MQFLRQNSNLQIFSNSDHIHSSGVIKAVVFHNVVLSWMILTKEHSKFSVEKHFIEWCTGGPWFNEEKSEPIWHHI